MSSSVIVAGARTPIGKFGGAFAGLAAVDLGAVAVREALARGVVAAEDVDYVILGHVIQAGAGQITARQAAIAAGIPKEVPALTVNKVCLSGMNAIAHCVEALEHKRFQLRSSFDESKFAQLCDRRERCRAPRGIAEKSRRVNRFAAGLRPAIHHRCAADARRDRKAR